MKKAYETPMVEKIAFNYRDQIVVASGEVLSENGGNSIRWNDSSVCAIIDVVTRGAIDWISCY